MIFRPAARFSRSNKKCHLGTCVVRNHPLGSASLRTGMTLRTPLEWGHSSAGRALAWHARGQRFDPAWLHQFLPFLVVRRDGRVAPPVAAFAKPGLTLR